jgi:hypothetical protein
MNAWLSCSSAIVIGTRRAALRLPTVADLDECISLPIHRMRNDVVLKSMLRNRAANQRMARSMRLRSSQPDHHAIIRLTS